ncbi:hypothetical protein CYY_002118 [Polysphondylium violaceum]|uniref:Uncharacterized protein n=1 Tax=Polysphondylium violaceum TaxID=133409 RepID=A0A8J4Q0P6_9MYCE|nr:hypothetical protein CYY_002118 [Polysphondylium violaceum]
MQQSQDVRMNPNYDDEEPEEDVSDFEDVIKQNDVRSLINFFKCDEYVQLPIRIILPAIIENKKRILKVLFKNRSFKHMAHKIHFPLLVHHIIATKDRGLFILVMNHFQPKLYKFLVANRTIVDPYVFYKALDAKDVNFLMACFHRWGQSESVRKTTLKLYKRFLPTLESVGVVIEKIQYIFRDENFFVVFYPDKPFEAYLITPKPETWD